MAGCFILGVVRWGSVLLLLILGAEQSEGNCLEKVQECLQITMNLAGIASSGGDYTALCPSAVQNMTQCVESAKTLCSGQQETLKIVQSQLDYLKGNYCSADGVCRAKAAICAIPILPIVGNATTITVASVMQFCSSAVQNMTQCVESAKTLCSGQQEILNTVQSQLDYLKGNYCSADRVCREKASSCTIPILGIVGNGTTITVAAVMQLCSVAPAVSSCVQKLDANCRKLPEAAAIISSVTKMSTFCGYLSNRGACIPAVSCFTSLTDPANITSPPCDIIGSVVDCLKDKAKLKNCRFDESKVTFADISALTVDVCQVANKGCAKAEACISVPDLPRNPFGENPSASNQQTVADKLADPTFFCQLVNKVAGCYSTYKDKCGFNPELMDKIKGKHESLKKQCPDGAPRGTSPGLLCYLMVLLPLLISVWQRF